MTHTAPLRVGLVGYGKAGQAVASVLSSHPRTRLAWIAKQRPAAELDQLSAPAPIVPLARLQEPDWLDAHPVDALVDFSMPEAIRLYGPIAQARGWRVVSAISAYTEDDLAYARELGQHIPVMCSPNITIGINFLILAARLLRSVAPFADVEILEQHFRDKPEVSGTARKIAQTLDLTEERITSMRLGGIVGHHEVIFGFPHQTVRLIHNSIQRQAFGTGAVFALEELAKRPAGFYTFEKVFTERVLAEMAQLNV